MKHLKYLLLFSLSFIVFGCGGDNDDEPNTPGSVAEYYVKYEASIVSYRNGTVKYTVNTETGEKIFSSGKSFSQTFGPVEKGFHASIKVDAKNVVGASSNIRIYVCRGNEPFALKANKSGESTVSASYTIDF